MLVFTLNECCPWSPTGKTRGTSMFFGGIRRSIPSYAQGFGGLSSSHSSTAIGRGLLRRRIKSDYKTGIQTQSEIPKPLGTWSILWPVLSSSFFYSLSFIRFSPISSGKCSFRTRERTGKRNQRNSSRIPIAKPISRKDPR